MGNLERIDQRGYTWKAVYDLLDDFITNWLAFLVKIDADLGDTDYTTDYPFTSDTVTFGATYGKMITPLACPQGKVVELLYNMRTNMNAVLDAIAADDGVNGTTVFTALKFATTARVIDSYGGKIMARGQFNDEVVKFLDEIIPKFNSLLLQCDNDTSITDTDYESTLGMADVVAPSSSSSSSLSLSVSSSSSSCRSSSSSSSSCSSSSSSCRSSSSSSSSSCRSSSSSSCLSSSSSSSCRSSSSSSSSSSCRSSSSSSSSSRSSSSSMSSSSSSNSSSSSSCRSSSSSSQSIG